MSAPGKGGVAPPRPAPPSGSARGRRNPEGERKALEDTINSDGFYRPTLIEVYGSTVWPDRPTAVEAPRSPVPKARSPQGRFRPATRVPAWPPPVGGGLEEGRRTSSAAVVPLFRRRTPREPR